MKTLSLDAIYKILDELEEVYWQWDIERKTLYYSAQLMKLLGYEERSYSDSNVLLEKHVSKEYFENIYQMVEHHIKGDTAKIDITYAFTTKNDDELWLQTAGKIVEDKDSGKTFIFGILHNITDTKKIFNQLNKQNNRLNLAERISNSGHWRYDIKKEIFSFSEEAYRIFGVSSKKFVPNLTNVVSFIAEKDQETFITHITRAINKFTPFHLKISLVLANKKKIKIEIIAEIEFDLSGSAQAIFGVFKDITRSEDLFEKLKLLAMVNYTIKVPIFFIDDNDNIVYQDISPHYDSVSSVLFNYINFSISEYMSFKKQAKEQGQIKQTSVSFDKYNSVFDLSVTYEAEEGIYIWIVENVTDLFRQEQQQIISNRLALLGNTFGNVSHDINNVLGVALGAIEMLELKFSRGDKNISTYIDRVKNAIDKGKSVTERLLAFTRKPTIKVISFDPIQDVKDNQYLFEQLLLSTININFSFAPVHCLINFPKGEFINILLNLVLNAQDAIQENGLSGQINVSVNLGEEDRLEIHVTDSGIGIAPENLTKIFDPFYSSKSINKGNGIGLANVYNTMYKHNGVIQVEGESDLGGAHFTLIFKCKKLKSKFQPIVEDNSSFNLKDKSILVLDDEVSIAEFVALFLENNGANVVIANNRSELIEQINSGVIFDIFITDMILPDLSGKEAVHIVKEKYPEIKIYSISGYIAIEDSSWDYPVLRKPFNSKELSVFLSA
ncbi:MAG: ATP-binding protein [Colwellia sp.]